MTPELFNSLTTSFLINRGVDPGLRFPGLVTVFRGHKQEGGVEVTFRSLAYFVSDYTRRKLLDQIERSVIWELLVRRFSTSHGTYNPSDYTFSYSSTVSRHNTTFAYGSNRRAVTITNGNGTIEVQAVDVVELIARELRTEFKRRVNAATVLEVLDGDYLNNNQD